MATQNNESIVRDVVNEFVKNGRSFTAFNVTTEAKKRGADERHNDLKGVVHLMFKNNEITGYSRTKTDIPGNSIRPFLYKPASNSGSPDQDDDAIAAAADTDDQIDDDIAKF